MKILYKYPNVWIVVHNNTLLNVKLLKVRVRYFSASFFFYYKLYNTYKIIIIIIYSNNLQWQTLNGSPTKLKITINSDQ